MSDELIDRVYIINLSCTTMPVALWNSEFWTLLFTGSWLSSLPVFYVLVFPLWSILSNLVVTCEPLIRFLVSNRLELHLKEEGFWRMLKQRCNVKLCGLIWLMKWPPSFVAFVLKRCSHFPKKLIAIFFKIPFGVHDCCLILLLSFHPLYVNLGCQAYLQQELEKLHDLRNKVKLEGELWDDLVSSSSQNSHLVSKATRLWESILARKS